MSDTKQQQDEEECEKTRQPAAAAEREKPEFRSHVGRGKAALDQLKEEDRVRFAKSPTESPIWTVDDIDYDGVTKRKVYKLRKPDGSLHEEWVTRERLTLQT